MIASPIMGISRRDFIGTAALGAVAAPLVSATGMPMRPLGSTGARVSILAFGSGSRFLMYKKRRRLEALTHALDPGITYIDTGDEYGATPNSASARCSRARPRGRLPGHQDQPARGRRSQRVLEESLKRLQVDRVDLLHIHALTTEDDLAKIEAKGGVLEVLKVREQKMARFIGITSHADPR